MVYFLYIKYGGGIMARERVCRLPATAKKRKLSRAKLGTWAFAYAVLALPIIYFFIFYVYVNFSSIALAFQSSKTGKLTFENFRFVWHELTRSGTDLFGVLKNTMTFWLLGWIMMPINIVVSFILYKQIRGNKFFQTVFYLPSIISAVVWMTAYKNFINPEGPLMRLFASMGFYKNGVPELLNDSRYAFGAVIGSSVWLGIPSNMLIYCGSLCRIPHDVIEAARLDGVGFWGEIRHVTFPLLGPLIATQVLLHCTTILNSSGNVLLLTEGKWGTSTLNYWLYEQVVVSGQVNIPSAMGLLMTLVTIPIVVLSRFLTRRIEDIEY